MTDPDPKPFADCHVIVCYGRAKLVDKHLAATVHCVDDEIIGWLKRREQRRESPRVVARVAADALKPSSYYGRSLRLDSLLGLPTFFGLAAAAGEFVAGPSVNSS
jgi:hypothetical protein